MDAMGQVRDGQERALGPVEGETTGRRPWLGLGAAGLLLPVLGSGQLVEQGGDVFCFVDTL